MPSLYEDRKLSYTNRTGAPDAPDDDGAPHVGSPKETLDHNRLPRIHGRAEGDPVTCPAHYAGDGEVEAKRALRSMLVGYERAAPALPYEQVAWAAMAFKYIWRFPGKSGLQDVRKARECLDNVIRSMETDAKRPAGDAMPDGLWRDCHGPTFYEEVE